MFLKHKQDNNPKKTLEEAHQKGFIIAQDHLTPLLIEFKAEHDFSKLEMASAFIILAYSIIHGAPNKPHKNSLNIFKYLCNLSIELINKRQAAAHFSLTGYNKRKCYVYLCIQPSPPL